MKNVLFVLLASVAAHAATLNCVVPQEGAAPTVTAVIEASEESQGDFVTFTINEPNVAPLVYFNQIEKGEFARGIASGTFMTVVLAEDLKVENGVIKGAGILVLEKNGTDFAGLATVNNSIYPLQCK